MPRYSLLPLQPFIKADITTWQRFRTPINCLVRFSESAGASTLFAVALLASGQNSTLTGTLAGQVVMEGFLRLRLPPVLRRLITRLLAIIPAVIVTALMGEHGTAQIVNLEPSDLEHAVKLRRNSSGNVYEREGLKMGEFVNSRSIKISGWALGIVIAVLNAFLLWQTFSGSAPK